MRRLPPALFLAATAALAVVYVSHMGQGGGAAQARQPTPEVLASGPGVVEAGNPDGDVTIVEFLDHQCPVCRQVHPVLKQVVEEDGNVRLAYRLWPIFGEASEEAARLALAAREQGRFEAVHEAFLGLSGRLSVDRVRAAAETAGLDLTRAEATLETQARQIAETLGRNRLLADRLGLRGTPAFFIGDIVIPGGATAEDFRAAIAEARASR